MKLEELTEIQGIGCIGRNVRNVYKLSDTDYFCQLDLVTNTNIEVIDYYTSVNDNAITGQWVMSQILSGKAGKLKSKEQYENDILIPKCLEEIKSHDQNMLILRQHAYNELNTKAYGLQKIGEMTDNQYQNEIKIIKQKYPKLNEIKKISKNLLMQFPYLKYLETNKNENK